MDAIWKDLPRQHPFRIEMEKWEKPNYDPTKHPFPKMLYKARVTPDGRNSCGETNDALFGGGPGAAEAWTRGCQLIVGEDKPGALVPRTFEDRDREYKAALEQGWRDTQEEAMAFLEAKQRAIADAAANRHYEDRNMSDAAKAEAAAEDSATSEHVAEVKRKPGRPKKVVQAA